VSTKTLITIVLLSACSSGKSGRREDFSLGKANLASPGLDRHDALYCGEWQLTNPGETIYLVKGGKVVWWHSIPDKDELGDCTMTSYGHVLFARKSYGAQEVEPDVKAGQGGKVVWEYLEDPGTEVHSVQPVGTDKALVMQNGTPAKLMLINKKAAASCHSDQPCVEKMWTPESHGSTHGMFRHVRMLANGNLLIPYTGGGQHRVVEYSPETPLRPVWEYDEAPSPWAAVRLKNGNTLISGNQHKYVREVTPDKKVVWELTQQDLPQIPFYTLQEATRLANGNTLVNNWCGGGLPKTEWASSCVQVFEVTPDKKVVWQVKQWDKPNLGPGSSTQLLDEPGTPEKPGEIQR
jgi:Mala s 1-like protein